MSYNTKIQSLLTIPEKISKNRIQRSIVHTLFDFRFWHHLVKNQYYWRQNCIQYISKFFYYWEEINKILFSSFSPHTILNEIILSSSSDLIWVHILLQNCCFDVLNYNKEWGQKTSKMCWRICEWALTCLFE